MKTLSTFTCTPRVREQLFGWVLLLPTFLFAGLFAFYPILYSFWLSLHNQILSLAHLGSPWAGLENYRKLVQDPVALRALVNTFGFVFASTFLELLAGLGIALLIHRRFRGRGWTRAAVLIPWAVPTVVASQMWRFIMNDQYGFFNLLLYGKQVEHYRAWLADPLTALAVIIAADVWKTSSFAALLILAGLQTIPEDLYESARLDGASPWQQFRKITLPLLKPALLIAVLFRTMDAFRVFDLVFVMTQGGPADGTNVLQFYGYKKIFGEGFLGYGSTISVLVFLAVFLISLVYLRIIGTGLFREGR